MSVASRAKGGIASVRYMPREPCCWRRGIRWLLFLRPSASGSWSQQAALCPGFFSLA